MCLVNSLIHAKLLSVAFLFPSISSGWDTSGDKSWDTSGDKSGSSRSENILSKILFVWKLWGAETRPDFPAAATLVSDMEWALGEPLEAKMGGARDGNLPPATSAHWSRCLSYLLR